MKQPIDQLEDMINELAEDFRISRCEAAAMVARVLRSADVGGRPPAELIQLIEASDKQLFAKCLGDNDYLFKRLTFEG